MMKKKILFMQKKEIYLSENNQYNFQLSDGFKISIDKKKQIEKLEFLNYILKIDKKNIIIEKLLIKIHLQFLMIIKIKII